MGGGGGIGGGGGMGGGEVKGGRGERRKGEGARLVYEHAVSTDKSL